VPLTNGDAKLPGKNQIGRNVQVYIDNMVITTREEATLNGDL
jgi:hypothetical protein